MQPDNQPTDRTEVFVQSSVWQAERIQCFLLDGNLFLEISGIPVQVPHSLVARSRVLSDVVSIVAEGTFSMTVPAGCLQGWLEYTSPQLSSGLLASRNTRHLVGLLLAADFFADEQAIPWLGCQLGFQLFAGQSVRSSTASAATKDELVAVIKELPGHVASCVLRAAPSLDFLLATLPGSLHKVAVQAFYPSISTDSVLVFTRNDHSNTTASAVLKVATAAAVRQLHYTRYMSFRQCDMEMLQSLSQACRAVDCICLHIEHLRFQVPPEASTIFSSMARNIGLTKLELSCSSDTLLGPLLGATADLSRLQHISFSAPAGLATSMFQLPQVFAALGHLTLLTCLRLSGCTPDGLALSSRDLSCCLSKLLHLQILSLSLRQEQATTPSSSSEIYASADVLGSCSHLSQLRSLQLEGTFFNSPDQLRSLSSLTALHCLQPQTASDITLPTLAQCLRELRALVHLNASVGSPQAVSDWVCSSTGGIEPLIDALSAADIVHSCTQLRVYMQSPSQSHSFLEHVRRLPMLRSLLVQVQGCEVLHGCRPATLTALGTSLSRLTSLVIRDADTHAFNVPHPEFARVVLPALVGLLHLEFDHSYGSRDALFTSALVRMTDLQHLYLRYDFDARVAARQNGSALGLLTQLCLGFLYDSPSLPSASESCVRFFGQLTNLQTLHLGVWSGAIMSVSVITSTLAKLVQLRRLEMKGDHVSACPHHVLPELVSLTLLESLAFIGSLGPHIVDGHVRVIAAALPHFQHLRSISLWRIELLHCTDSGMLSLTSALSGLLELQSVELWFVEQFWHDGAMQALMGPLRNLPKLRRVCLGNGYAHLSERSVGVLQ